MRQNTAFAVIGLCLLASASNGATLGITKPNVWGETIVEEMTQGGDLFIIWQNNLGVEIKDFHIQIMSKVPDLKFKGVVFKEVFATVTFSDRIGGGATATGSIANFYNGTIGLNKPFRAQLDLDARGKWLVRYAATTDGDGVPPIPLPGALSLMIIGPLMFCVAAWRRRAAARA